MPVWIDITDEHAAYTIPDIENRGFKLAFDKHGEEFDPDTGDRLSVESKPPAVSWQSDFPRSKARPSSKAASANIRIPPTAIS